MKKSVKEQNAPRRDWVRPELRRIEAGAAESSHLNVADGGGGNQAS